MDWTGDAKQTVPSHAILQGVHTMSSVLHSARKRYGKWWLTGFQVTTQRLVMQKEFSGESSSNHQEEMALEICRNTRDRCPPGLGCSNLEVASAPELLPMPPSLQAALYDADACTVEPTALCTHWYSSQCHKGPRMCGASVTARKAEPL